MLWSIMHLILSRQREMDSASGASGVLKDFMKKGHEHKRCPLCERDMNTQELVVFEKTVSFIVVLLIF